MSSTPNNPAAAGSRGNGIPRVIVATTALLTLISFWRAAAIVLNDLASSAYYAGGEAEGYIGKTAPWFILAIMLFSYAVRAVYVESCSMFVRGGVYRAVKQALGGTLAKFSVSALMFDYILTGPISGVAAGQYLAGLISELLQYTHLGNPLTAYEVNFIAASFAVLVTVYFWWENTKGIPESSEKALLIMKLVTVMVVLLIAWCTYTAISLHSALPPWPHPRNLRLDAGALGWLAGSSLPHMFGIIAIFIGLGHSVLAMSGEESLAQVYREIEHPKLPNLKKAGLVIFIYSLVFTSLVSFFAVMIIPDGVRQSYLENLIGGLAMNLQGPMVARLTFHVFVVVVGTLILAGAVNTAIVGSNGVLNRVSEDGVLSSWFRQPHPRFGTSYRIINIIVGLQILTIFISRGDVTFLANLYAFGVIWSFTMNGLAVLVLRYTRPGQREFQVPFNFHIRGVQIPVGLGLITLTLLLIAITNLFTKPVATMAGGAFSVLLFFRIHDFRTPHAQRRLVPRGDGPVQSGAGVRTNAGSCWCPRRQYPCPGQQPLQPLSLGKRSGPHQTRPTRRGCSARPVVAPFSLWRKRARRRPAFRKHRAASFLASALHGGKARQVDPARGGCFERFVGRHFASRRVVAIQHYRDWAFCEGQHGGASATNWRRLGKARRHQAAVQP